MTKRNLADPDFEPSDEDFRELLHNAMIDVREGWEETEREFRERIQAERARMKDGSAREER